MKKISIIGLGVVGRVTSLMALEYGFAVDIYDKNSLSSEDSASYIAGGMISPISELDYCSSDILEYYSFSMNWWKKIEQEIKVDLKIKDTLICAFQQDASELELIKKRIRLTKNPISENVPCKLGFTGFKIPREGFLNPRKFFRSSNRFFQNHKKCHFFQKKLSNDLPGLEGSIIDCRGIGAKNLKNLRGVRGELLEVFAKNVQIDHIVRLYHPRYPLYIIPRGAGLFSLGASMIESDDNSAISVRTSLEILTTAVSYDEGFLEARILNSLVGIRPTFPSSLPKICKNKNSISINGVFRNGYLYAPSLAHKVLREII